MTSRFYIILVVFETTMHKKVDRRTEAVKETFLEGQKTASRENEKDLQQTI